MTQSRKGSQTLIQPGKEPPTELIQHFLQNQTKELEIKARELELQKQADVHSFQFSKISLDAQVADRKEARTHSLSSQRTVLLFCFAVIAIICLFLCYAIYSGKDQIAMELIKAIIFLIAGGGGGYAVGRHKKSRADAENEEDEYDSQ
jgi:hypothetical protein